MEKEGYTLMGLSEVDSLKPWFDTGTNTSSVSRLCSFFSKFHLKTEAALALEASHIFSLSVNKAQNSSHRSSTFLFKMTCLLKLITAKHVY